MSAKKCFSEKMPDTLLQEADRVVSGSEHGKKGKHGGTMHCIEKKPFGVSVGTNLDVTRSFGFIHKEV